MNNETLATELLKQTKTTIKRLFVALIVVICLWFATIGGFIVYLSLPDEEVTVENESGNANYVGEDMNGVINNGENSGDPTEQTP